MEKAAVPEGVGVAAASKGQRKLTKAPRTPRKKHDMIVIQPIKKKSLVDSREEDHIVHDMCPTLT